MCSARPTTYRSPGSTDGSRADLAASKGGVNRVEHSSRISTSGSGSGSTATTVMITIRPTSQNTITLRYGYRSASETSTDPPSSHGA